jgi:hypothetical protein
MFKNKTILIHTLINLLISQGIFWLVFLNQSNLPVKIPLWFLMQWGEDQLAPVQQVWWLPGLSIGFLAINLITIAYLYRRRPFLVGMVLTMTTILNLFLLMATLNVFNRVFGWI